MTWKLLSLTKNPPGRFLAAMAYDPANKTTIMMGGLVGGNTLADSWAWNGKDWTELSTAPTARQTTAMAYDPVHRDIVLFAGCGPVNVSGVGCGLGDTWIFSAKTQTWTEAHPATSPPATFGESLAWDPVNKRILLFGGCAVDCPSNQQWTWNGTTWASFQTTTTPPPVYDMTMVTDPVHDEIMLFGGASRTGGDQTWIFNGTTWTLEHPATSPAADWEYGAAWDPSAGVAVLYGGIIPGGKYLPGTWIWNGQTWAKLELKPRPLLREGPSMATDPAGGVVLFGGSIQRFSGRDRTWQLL
jgi:hypothetical protein